MNTVSLAIFTVAGALAFLLRFDFSVPVGYQPHLLVALCVWVPVKAIVFHLLKSDRAWWRYASIRDVVRLGVANFAGAVLSFPAILWLSPLGFPRSIYFLDFLICFGMTATARLAVRLAFEFSRLPNLVPKKRTLIYGAGDAGFTLLQEIRRNPALPYNIVGFIDDDSAKAGSFFYSARVLGCGAELASIVSSAAIETILIAMPSATGEEMTRILNRCQDTGVSYKTVPALADVIAGNSLLTQVRDVAVEDLLGRAPARLDHEQISATIAGKTVLVTGAAGSIGSELCRQIACFNPRAIVGFDIAETALFYLDREMHHLFPAIPFHPEIGSTRDRQRVAEVLRQFRPAILYHAAAYKHVPMMETNAFEAVENNVFGTCNVALAATEQGVQNFVLISSDKAVRPANIMGATKRLAELVVLAQRKRGVKFVSVRFGNVLGSNGSVIPIFKQQIADGGPVTVTHSEMHRYFMTIPEASKLVLQASTMGRGGEIFVLDMGKPVRILDLARNLILLSGLRPDEDIKVELTGVRPGEKLYEELNLRDEDVVPTHHERIRIFAGNGLPDGGIDIYLEALREVCARRDLSGLVLILKDLIPDYDPSAHLRSRALSASDASRPTSATPVY